MLVVIPVGSKSDETNLALLASATVTLGKIENHSVKIISVPSMLVSAEKAAQEIRKVCPQTTCVSTEDELAGGWFLGCNRMWRWTVLHLDAEENLSPWFWMEPDCCPTKEGWLDSLANAYQACGKAFMGHVRPTKWKNPDGSIFTKEGDNMLLGNAVYPPMLSRDQNISPLLTDLGYSDPRSHAPDPWDVYLRWLMFRRGVADTVLFRDHWKTKEYARKEDRQIVFKSCEKEESGIVEDGAVVVHGCKDGSLHRLISGVKAEVKTATKEIIPLTKPAPISNEQHSKYQKVLQCLLSSGKTRITNVIIMTGLPKDDILQILPKLGYQVKKAGWIEKRVTKV